MNEMVEKGFLAWGGDLCYTTRLWWMAFFLSGFVFYEADISAE
jgi:hypothetical protein